MGLMTLFDSVNVEAEAFLSPADQLACEQIERDYYATLDQLKSSLTFLNVNKKAFEPESPVTTDAFQEMLFEPPFEDIQKAIDSLGKVFVKEIVGYVNAAYNLNFTADKSLKATTYQEVIATLLENGEGGFAEKGLKLAVKNFKNSAYSKSNKLKGKIVTLGNYSLGSYDWNFVSCWNDSYKALMLACGWIETGKVASLPQFERVLHGDLKPTGEWLPTAGTRLTGFKLFANKRIDLEFISSEVAYEFFTTMELDQKL